MPVTAATGREGGFLRIVGSNKGLSGQSPKIPIAHIRMAKMQDAVIIFDQSALGRARSAAIWRILGLKRNVVIFRIR